MDFQQTLQMRMHDYSWVIHLSAASNWSSCIEHTPTRITKFINNRGAMLWLMIAVNTTTIRTRHWTMNIVLEGTFLYWNFSRRYLIYICFLESTYIFLLSVQVQIIVSHCFIREKVYRFAWQHIIICIKLLVRKH